MPILWTELVFKVSTPTTLSTSTISEGITSLQHEFLYDSVENDIVVVTIVDVCDKVFDRLRGSVWEQFEVLFISEIASDGRGRTISPMVV
jgi:hypothetical protein